MRRFSETSLAALLEWLRAEGGQTMTEYGMLLSVIALVVVALALTIGAQISALFVPVLALF